MTDYKIINLRGKNGIVGEALVSVEDYDNVNKYKWYMRKTNGPIYAHGPVNGKDISMHQFIMGKAEKGFVIDHKNHNGLDNQRQNLNFITYSANSQNRIKKKNTINNYIGVKKEGVKFCTTHCRKRIGLFETELEAAKHYDKYVKIKYKNSCITNFPVSDSDINGLTLDDLILIKPKKSGLPDNINMVKINDDIKYYARKNYNCVQYKSKIVKTLKEAIEELKLINNKIETIKENLLNDHYKKPIERNQNNEAIIILKNKNNENVGECIVDDKYWHELSLYKWNISTCGYAISDNIIMHRFIMKKINKNIEIIDHINHNRIDNRVSNLRSVNHMINAHNKLKRKNCTSKYIGVHKSGNKWIAQINYNYKHINLGTFDNEIDAAKEYNKKAIEFYKEYANLNNFT